MKALFFPVNPPSGKFFVMFQNLMGQGINWNGRFSLSRQGSDRMSGAFSDILVGADGVLYLRIGMIPWLVDTVQPTESTYGKIYRIAPKGFKAE